MQWMQDRDSQTEDTALVVCHEVASGAWHPQVLQMENDLEERLDGVYVAMATETGRYPRTDDALAAVRYAGCHAAVVVRATSDRANGAPKLESRRGVTMVTVGSEWSADAVVSAFQDAKALVAPMPESVAV